MKPCAVTAVRRARILVALIATLQPSAGCASTLPEAVPPVHITVNSLTTTNDNRPLHCMVRAVEPEVAMMEDYDEAAALIFSADESLRARGVVFPGRPLELDVTLDPNESVAVYFFFTDPSDAWVVPVPAPLPASLEITLGSNEVSDWSPRAGADASSAPAPAEGLVLPPIGGAAPAVTAPALPSMPDAPELEVPTPPQAPRFGR